jgi:thymidylate kinase
MDMSISRDRFESFFEYQRRLREEFEWMTRAYSFRRVDANRMPHLVHKDVIRLVSPIYQALPEND